MVNISRLVETVTGLVPEPALTHETRHEETYEAPQSLSVSADSAAVRLIGEDRSDVAATLEVQASSRDRLRDVQLRATGETSLRLSVERSSGWGGVNTQRVESTLMLRVPNDLSISSVETKAGEIEARSVSVARLQTKVGSVEGVDLSGDVSARSEVGTVELREVAGYVAAETKTGSILVEDTDGVEDLQTSSGSVTARVNAIRGPTSISAKTGSVTVTAGPELAADVSLSSQLGGVDADGLAGETDGEVGGGGHRLTVESAMGRTTFRQASE